MRIGRQNFITFIEIPSTPTEFPEKCLTATSILRELISEKLKHEFRLRSEFR